MCFIVHVAIVEACDIFHSNLCIELKLYFLHNVFSPDDRITIYFVFKDDISYFDLPLPYRCQ